MNLLVGVEAIPCIGVDDNTAADLQYVSLVEKVQSESEYRGKHIRCT